MNTSLAASESGRKLTISPGKRDSGHGIKNGHANGTSGHHDTPFIWQSQEESLVALAIKNADIARELTPDLTHDLEITWRYLKETRCAGETFKRLDQIARSDSADAEAAIDALQLIQRLSGHT